MGESADGTNGAANIDPALIQSFIDKMAADGSEPLNPELVQGFFADIISVLGVSPEAIVPDAKFQDDLDVDSLDAVEIGMALDERFGISLEEDELERFTTVASAIGLIATKVAEKDNPPS